MRDRIRYANQLYIAVLVALPMDNKAVLLVRGIGRALILYLVDKLCNPALRK
jgi:hypothetical protein